MRPLSDFTFAQSCRPTHSDMGGRSSSSRVRSDKGHNDTHGSTSTRNRQAYSTTSSNESPLGTRYRNTSYNGRSERYSGAGSVLSRSSTLNPNDSASNINFRAPPPRSSRYNPNQERRAQTSTSNRHMMAFEEEFPNDRRPYRVENRAPKDYPRFWGDPDGPEGYTPSTIGEPDDLEPPSASSQSSSRRATERSYQSDRVSERGAAWSLSGGPFGRGREYDVRDREPASGILSRFGRRSKAR